MGPDAENQGPSFPALPTGYGQFPIPFILSHSAGNCYGRSPQFSGHFPAVSRQNEREPAPDGPSLQIAFIVQRPAEKSIKILLIFLPQTPLKALQPLFFLSFPPFLLSKASMAWQSGKNRL